MRGRHKDAAEWLGSLPFLQGLDDSALAEVSGLAQKRSFASGEIIVLEGEPCTTVYFIVKGWVRVSKVSLEGREQVMIRLGPGDGCSWLGRSPAPSSSGCCWRC